MSSIVPGPLHAGRVRAAAYVRMSTERQVYSTANQLDRIRQYAADRDIDLVAIYEDAGKSGLTKRGRAGLSRLIDDVQRAHDFTLILALRPIGSARGAIAATRRPSCWRRCGASTKPMAAFPAR